MPVFLGFLGVLAFSFTLPATRVAVEELDPVFVGIGREALAAVLAGAILMAARAPLPTRPQLKSLAIVASGVVFGWPAVQRARAPGLTSAHSAVVIGILPAATAVAAVLRAGEHPTRGFWVASLAGLASVLVFAATQGAGVSWRRHPDPGRGRTGRDRLRRGRRARARDGRLAGDLLGGLPVRAADRSRSARSPRSARDLHASGDAWLGFAYVAVISALIGFFPWYAGLARGGVAKIGQVQLLQPLLTLAWSALLLGEHIGAATIVASIAVLASVVATQRTRVTRSSRPPLVTSGQ